MPQVQQSTFLNPINIYTLNINTGFTITGGGGVPVSAGDMNGDGFSDILVPSGSVLFGKNTTVGGVYNLDLPILDGSNGFTSNAGPSSVSTAGDMNADGFSDILICNNGNCYVVFGKSTPFNSPLDLTQLNGNDGFKISGGSGGFTVSNAFDINNDGFDDILIGDPNASPNGKTAAGSSYVVFGKSTPFSSVLALSSLDGNNGFKVNGEAIGDYSGWSLSGVDDVNGDGFSDIFIGTGAYSDCSPYEITTDSSYVVFGKNIPFSNVIELANLDVTNGFKINEIGMCTGYDRGCLVSSAGDINHDGFSDLLIACVDVIKHYYDRVDVYVEEYIDNFVDYIVFGKNTPFGSPIELFADLSSLDGNNGFQIIQNCLNYSPAVGGTNGDINGDGFTDLSLSILNSPGQGGYVLFGKYSPFNSAFELGSLDGNNGFRIYGCYVVINMGDVNKDGFSDFLCNDGSLQSHVIYGDKAPILYYMSFDITEGQTFLLNSSYLNATSQILSVPAANLGFLMYSVQYGQFEDIAAPGVAITHFSQQQIWDSQIRLVHDGRELAPVFYVSAISRMAFTVPQPVIITLTHVNDAPTLVANTINLIQGQPTLLSNTNFNSIDPDNTASQLTYHVFFNISAGQFELVNDPNNAITDFTQAQINNNQIQYKHDGSLIIPNFSVQVSDLQNSTTPATTQVNLNYPPILVNNYLPLHEGETLVLTAVNFNSTDPNNSPDQLIFSLSNVQQGQFALVNNPSTTITVFTQSQINNNQIQFSHNGNELAANYNFQLSDGQITLPVTVGNISFTNVDDAPILVNNQLSIQESATVIFNSTNLSAIDIDSNLNNLIFIANNIQNGKFTFVNNSASSINSFMQQQVQNNEIQFVHDGSENAPAYQVAVSDGILSTGFYGVAITNFTHVNDAPAFVKNYLYIDQGGTAVITLNDTEVTDVDGPTNQLSFVASVVQHGRFERGAAIGVAISSFTYGDVDSDIIRFIHDGSENPPSYYLSVSDSLNSSAPIFANITFNNLNNAPVLVNNRLTIIEGESVLISSNELSAMDPDPTQITDNLQFTIYNLQHGSFNLIDSNTTVTNFAQREISQNNLQFIHNGDNAAPSYAVTVTDSQIVTQSEFASIDFTFVNDPPSIDNNQITMNRGQTIVIARANLKVSDEETAPEELLISITNLQHGTFLDGDNANAPVTEFYQQKIIDNVISLQQDGSDQAPSYDVSVTDGNSITGPESAVINFNDNLVSNNNLSTQSYATIGGLIGGVGLLLLLARVVIRLQVDRYRKQALEGSATEVEKQRAQYYSKTLAPLIDKLFQTIKITWFLGYISEQSYNQYVTAVETLATKLDLEKIDLDFENMSAARQTQVLNTISAETQRLTVEKTECCSARQLVGLFKPHVTPEQIMQKSKEIAQSVKTKLNSEFNNSVGVISSEMNDPDHDLIMANHSKKSEFAVSSIELTM